MKRSYIYLLAGVLGGGLLLSSCTKTPAEEIEYVSRDGFYKAPRGVYFHFGSDATDHIIRESYGTKPDALTEFTVDVPVRHTGTISSSPLAYRVRVDEKASTAKVGVHFKPLAEQYTFPADSLKGTFPVTFIRSALQTVEGKSDTLTLVLEASTDLKAPFKELNRIKIAVNNGLQMTPEIWNTTTYAYLLGEYSLRKYRTLLKYYKQDELALYDEFSHLGDVERVYRFLLNIEAAFKELGEPLPASTANWLKQYRQ